MKLKSICGTVMLALSIFVTPGWATSIGYTVNNLGGNSWQYDYTVTNDTLGIDIEQLTIYFDHSLYSSLQAVTTSPTGWDTLEIQPDTVLQDDGFYDSLAQMGGIAPGDTLSGFSITFDFLGMGVPGAQAWEIVDPQSFATLESGMTFDASAMVVPEPDVRWLLMAGVLALAAARAGTAAVR